MGIKDIARWVKEGRDCCTCEAMWEARGYDDCDCGCMIKGHRYDEKPCRLIKPVRSLMIKRWQYFSDHQYDGIIEYYEERDKKNEELRKCFLDVLGEYRICYKDFEGNMHEVGIDVLDLWRLEDCVEGDKDRPTILGRWKGLLKDTVMIIPNKVKPFVCK